MIACKLNSYNNMGHATQCWRQYHHPRCKHAAVNESASTHIRQLMIIMFRVALVLFHFIILMSDASSLRALIVFTTCVLYIILSRIDLHEQWWVGIVCRAIVTHSCLHCFALQGLHSITQHIALLFVFVQHWACVRENVECFFATFPSCNRVKTMKDESRSSMHSISLPSTR